MQPFSDSDWAKLGDDTAALVKKHSISDKDANELNPEVWANESFEISKKFVYTGKLVSCLGFDTPNSKILNILLLLTKRRG